MTLKELSEVWFRRVWAEGDQSCIDEMMAESAMAMVSDIHKPVGPVEFKAFHTALTALVSDTRVVVDKSFEDGPWISMLCTFTGKARDTGRAVAISGQIFARIEDGVIVEAYNHFDFMHLFGQLGLLPEDAFLRGLAGEKLA